MATAQVQRNIVSSVQIPTRVTTEQQSLALIKRLLAVSISCITYLRGLFPEYAYGTRYIEDICVKILREDKSCPGSTQLVKWMLGCYDALKKKYLRMAVIAIYTNPEDPQTITECYQFTFKYTASGPVMDFTSCKGDNSVSASSDIKQASILLIRKLYVLMQNLEPLPNDVCLTMKLFYYDEVTPADYQPPGFKEGCCDGMMFEGEPMHLSVGKMSTPFHVFKVKVTTEKDRMENVEKAVLKSVESKTPSQPTGTVMEDGKQPDHRMADELVNKEDWEKHNVDSMNIEEISLTCQETENEKPDQNEDYQDNETLSADSSPVAKGRRTRSGKIFIKQIQESSSRANQATSIKQRKTRQTDKRRQPFEIPLSQEELNAPKRRKYSEPKDPY
ncbi:HORMA domain-containing protein 1-like [Pelobates fuscus]|uniref:HORMA domain-containing protein 1-like n=1 Tax=Pelobates fuscus TaxID=191477 RepID=UPI002FE4AEAC